jgi:hypothetical protein
MSRRREIEVASYAVKRRRRRREVEVGMIEKMSSELADRLDAADPEEGVPVIVRLRPEADVSLLEDHGLQIRHRYETMPSVAGTLTAGHASELAALDEVELIESDEGEVRAL